MSIYQSGWNPRGYRKNWEKTSVTRASAETILQDWPVGIVTDACGWFDEDDNLRILAADTNDGTRIIVRITAKNITLEFSRQERVD